MEKYYISTPHVVFRYLIKPTEVQHATVLISNSEEKDYSNCGENHISNSIVGNKQVHTNREKKSNSEKDHSNREQKKHIPKYKRCALDKWFQQDNTRWIAEIPRIPILPLITQVEKSKPVKKKHAEKKEIEKKEVKTKIVETPKPVVIKTQSLKDRLKRNPLFRYK